MTNQPILKSIKEGDHLKGYQQEVRRHLSKNPCSIVILDDDPTGTQTVQNIPVVTQWSEEVLEKELLESAVFFVLTNSRSLQKKEAEVLAIIIGQRLKELAAKHNKNLLVISRGDSTLRGHYPAEVNALARGLGQPDAKHVLIPAFFEGGRFTFKDVHYVQEGNKFIPAAETPFAKDSTFGYNSSNLKEYIVEKHNGKIQIDQVGSIDLDLLRDKSIKLVNEVIRKYNYIVVNATSPTDLEAFALAALNCKETIIYRTAASFVNAITGIRTAPCLSQAEIIQTPTKNGALIVIGSYVPKTNAQLNHLKQNYKAHYTELDVAQLFTDEDLKNTLNKLATSFDVLLGKGQNVVVYTSRKVKKGSSHEDSLRIVNLVSKALTTLVGLIKSRPKFILAKGGITSSDIAVKSLQTNRAQVLGQVIKGVPVWRIDKHSKFPELSYIVFPGNVGSDEDLYNVLKKVE